MHSDQLSYIPGNKRYYNSTFKVFQVQYFIYPSILLQAPSHVRFCSDTTHLSFAAASRIPAAIRFSKGSTLSGSGVSASIIAGGCMNTIPPQRLIEISTNSKMIVCEYCGRILMNPEKND